MTEQVNHSVSLLPLVFSAIVFGPLGAFAVAAISNVWDLRDSRLKWCVYTPIRGLTAAAAGLAAWTLVPAPTSFGGFLVASLVAAAAYLAAECVLVGTTARLRGGSVPEVSARDRRLLRTHGSALRSGCGVVCLRLSPVLAKARPHLLPARTRGSAPAAALPAGKGREPGLGHCE